MTVDSIGEGTVVAPDNTEVVAASVPLPYQTDRAQVHVVTQ